MTGQPLGNWTPERIETLTQMWSFDGASASTIARALGGVTRSAVLGKINRLGLMGTRPKEVRQHNQRLAGYRHGGHRSTTPRKGAGRLRVVKERCAKGPSEPKKQRKTRRVVAPSRLMPERPHAAPVVFDATLAKPWTERRFGECAYPINGHGADVLSCCQPTEATYCDAHASVMFVGAPERPERLERMARRYA